MSQAGSQAAAFYREVAETHSVWSMRDAQGFPVYRNPEGKAVIPFWSSRSRLEAVQKSVPKFAAYEPLELPWDFFVEKWLPGLVSDGTHMGLNWSGVRAVGFDRDAQGVVDSVAACAGDGASS
jgi:hypothetical protein